MATGKRLDKAAKERLIWKRGDVKITPPRKKQEDAQASPPTRKG